MTIRAVEDWKRRGKEAIWSQKGLCSPSSWFDTSSGSQSQNATLTSTLQKLGEVHWFPCPSSVQCHHPDGKLWFAPVNVKWTNQVDLVLGSYQDSTHWDAAANSFAQPTIYLDNSLATPGPIIVHEVWHFVEREFLLQRISLTGGPAARQVSLNTVFASTTQLAYSQISNSLQKLKEVREGNEVRARLVRLYEREFGFFNVNDDPEKMLPSRKSAFSLVKFVSYLTSPEEWMARAHSQVLAQFANNEAWIKAATMEPFVFEYSTHDRQVVPLALEAQSLHRWRGSLEFLFGALRWR